MQFGRNAFVPRHVAAAGRERRATQMATPTPEMSTGFQTTTPYHVPGFEWQMYNNRSKEVTAASGTRYTLTIQAITPTVTGLIVAVNGTDLVPVNRRPVKLENRDGHVYIKPIS